MHLILYYFLCDRWADKLESLTATAMQDPESFLGHPVNAFKLMKRLNTEWGDLESLVLSDTTDGKDEDHMIQTVNRVCRLDSIIYFMFGSSDVTASAKSLENHWNIYHFNQ